MKDSYNCPGIYTITNIIDGKKYIGQSALISERFNSHKNDLAGNRHKNKHLQAAYNKYGPDSFVYDLYTPVPSIDELNEYEQKAINSFPRNQLYNSVYMVDYVRTTHDGSVISLAKEHQVRVISLPASYKDSIVFLCNHCDSMEPVSRTVQTIINNKETPEHLFRCNKCAYSNNNNRLKDAHQSKTFVKLQKLLPTVSEPHYVKIGNNFILFVTYNDKLYRATNLIRATKNRV